MSEIETVQNLHPEPRCLKKRGTWNGSSSANGEKWRYEKNTSATSGSVFAWGPLTNEQMSGKVLYARLRSDTQAVFDRLDIEAATTLVKHGEWIASRVPDGYVGNHAIWLSNGPFTLCEVGCYTPEDWEKLYDAYQRGDIEYPWVAGPRNATMAGEIGPWEL